MTGQTKTWIGNSSNLPNEIKFASGDTITGGGWWREIDRITSNKTWTVPDGITQIGVLLIGGGSSGYAHVETDDRYYRVPMNYHPSGYACNGHIATKIINCNTNKSFECIIGSGGNSASANGDGQYKINPGTKTQFGDIVAEGGGIIQYGSLFGTGIDLTDSFSYYNLANIPLHDASMNSGRFANGNTAITYTDPYFKFDLNLTFLPIPVSAYGVSYYTDDPGEMDYYQTDIFTTELGTSCLPGYRNSSFGSKNPGNAKSTDYGIAGGSCSASSGVATSGKGGPGIIIIYTI